MPIYAYVCKDCGAKFEMLVGVTLEEKELKCEKCGSKNVQRTLDSFSIGSAGSPSGSSGSCSTGTCPTCFN